MWGNRIALYLYGSRNILGCVCALLVMGLFFFGIIHAWWLPLTLGAYFFGSLIAPQPNEPLLKRLPQLALDQAIDAIMADFGPRIPVEARSQLELIQAQIHELAPRCNEPAFPSHSKIELINTVTRDLPETIANFLALPSSFARIHAIRDGKTAQVLLKEQLVLLHDELAEMATDIFANDADKLLSHGDYLKQKFQPFKFIES